MVNRIGEQLGNYRLAHLLGQGGFAEVYLAEHVHLRTQVAIKLLYGKLTAQDVAAFTTEAQTVARLSHPHILRVLDFGFVQTLPFLVMDYAPGGTLRDRHVSGSLVPLQQVISYIKQVARALAYAHANKLIHRDVKPENMLLSADGSILLSDFGIVTTAHSTASMKTLDNTGTVHYMAPEQIKGKPRPASDQYALAIVAYEWLCGERPFLGDTPIEIAMRQLSDDPPSLCQRVPALPPGVEQVIFRALAKDPAQRFPDILAFSSALEQPGQTQQSSRYSNTRIPALTRILTRRSPTASPPQQGLPPTVPAAPLTPSQPPQMTAKEASRLYEKLRKIVEKESQASVRGDVLGTVVVCTPQGQNQKMVVNLLEEADWIKGRKEWADVAYTKNYSVDHHMLSAAIFREVLPGDYMIWIHPEHPVSVYVGGGQTILVVL
ncbi:MAG TPA: serine/threonine-protein kinase [Ktedonobacteraceae bacterium]|nr:serine/threonine-protein kinase [Ktedonobacteraceae bacterium]